MSKKNLLVLWILTPAWSQFEVTLTGKMMLDTMYGHNKVKDTYYFAGEFIKDLYSDKAITPAPSHLNPTLFLVNASRLSTTATYTTGDTKYTANISLTADPDSPVKEAYGQSSSGWGTLTAGDTYGVESIFVQGPYSVVVGSGGTIGTWSKFLNTTTSNLLTMLMVGDTGNSTKVMYATPRIEAGLFRGWKMGVSFAPNTKHRAVMAMNTAAAPVKKAFAPFDLNSTAMGVNYLSSWNKSGSFGCSFVYLMGDTRPEKVINTAEREFDIKEEDQIVRYSMDVSSSSLNRFPTRAFDVAMVTKIGNWFVGAEYIQNKKSGQLRHNSPSAVKKDDPTVVLEYPIIPYQGAEAKRYEASQAGGGWMLNTCAGYDNRTFGISFSWLTSSVKTGFMGEGQTRSHRATTQVYVMSIQYYYAPGIAPYFECGVAKMHNPDWAHASKLIPFYTNYEYTGAPSNKGNFFTLGLKVNF